MKLNQTQIAVLRVAAGKYEIRYLDAVRVIGASGRTLHALVARALLVKHEYPDGSNAWRLTDAGRKAIGAEGAQ